MSEITLESTPEAQAEFDAFIKEQGEIAFVEQTNSLDGEKIITLVFEKLPAILTSIAALITAIKAKGLPAKLKKDGEETSVDKLESAK